MALENEDSIIERCQHGEMSAFETVYRHYEEPMLSLAYRLLGTREDAEDALQTAFLNLYRKIGQFHFQSAFSTWLYRIVVNACLDRLRKGKESAYVPLDATAELSRPDQTELGHCLQKAIEGLPPRMKACFVLFEMQGFKQREIAEMLRMKVGTVKAQVFEAKARLRATLRERWKGQITDGM